MMIVLTGSRMKLPMSTWQVKILTEKWQSLRMRLACSVITIFTPGLQLLVGSIAMKVNSLDAGKAIETPRSITLPMAQSVPSIDMKT
jgi:hypothetical protein